MQTANDKVSSRRLRVAGSRLKRPKEQVGYPYLGMRVAKLRCEFA